MKKKKLKKIWVVSLTLMSLLLVIAGSVAIYTSQVYQRAVVRNRYNDVIRFSSDKLYRVTDTPSPQIYYYPLDENQTTMNFTVCNYDQVKSTLYNDKDIQYNISFAITDGTAGFEYKVSCNGTTKTLSEGGATTIENKVLLGGQRSVDTYSVTFLPDDYGKVKVAVTVTPVDSTTTQNNKLNGILIPIEYATTQGVRLEWTYPDSGRGTPQDFDAYNLLVTLSGGQGSVVVSWDGSALDIDPFFVMASNGTSGTAKNGYTTLTVPMNSEDGTGTYLISFYNHNTTKPKWTAWSDLPITVTLVESSSQPTAP